MLTQRNLLIASALFGLVLGVGLWMFSDRRSSQGERAPQHRGVASSGSIKNLGGDSTAVTLTVPDTSSTDSHVNAVRVACTTLCQVGEFQKALDLIKVSELSETERNSLLHDLVELLLPTKWFRQDITFNIPDLQAVLRTPGLVDPKVETSPLLVSYLKDPIWTQDFLHRWELYLKTLDQFSSGELKCEALGRGILLTELIQVLSSMPNFEEEPERAGPNTEPGDQSNHSSQQVGMVPRIQLAEPKSGTLIEQLRDSANQTHTVRVLDSSLFNVARTGFLTVLFPMLVMAANVLVKKSSEVVASHVAQHVSSLLGEAHPSPSTAQGKGEDDD